MGVGLDDAARPERRSMMTGARTHGASLTRDFAVKFFIVAFLLTVGQLGFEYQYVKRLLLEQVSHRASAVADSFRMYAETDPAFSIAEAGDLATRKVRYQSDLLGIYLVNPQGHIVARAERDRGADEQAILDDATIHAGLSRSFDEQSGEGVDLTDHDRPVWAYIAPLPRLGVSTLVVVDLKSVQQEIEDELIGSMARRIAVLVILLATLYVLMRGWVLRPISDLAAAVRRSSVTGRFDPPAHMPSNEIGALAGLFGEVFGTLGRSIDENEMLAQVANGTHAGVLIANGAGEVIWSNAGFERMTGFRREEMIGRTAADIYSSRGKPIGAMAALGKSVDFNDGYNVEIVDHTRDGREYWASIEVRPILDGTGAIKNFIVIETDITEAKDTEAALKRSQRQLRQRVDELQTAKAELEEERANLSRTAEELAAAKTAAENADRARSDFLTATSQEIRAPMDGLFHMVDLLLESGLTPAQLDHVESIRESGGSLVAIVNRILDLSKLEAGNIRLHKLAASPRDIATSVVEQLRVEAERKGLALDCRITDGTPASVLCDPVRLRQILANLVGNAIKFTEEGSVGIEVAAAPGTMSGSCNLVFTVRDTGVGIPEKSLPKLFGGLGQIDGGMPDKRGDAGLGLSICRELATLMNGRIEVESEVGHGTTFRLEIPVGIVESAGTGPVPPENAAKPGSLNVLLAEDQPVNQKLMTAVMERLGHRLTIANNGVEALRCLERQPFDLVLMDIQMPELDGINATKIIRSSDEPWRNIPIIAVTAHAAESQCETYLAAGMNGFVAKPFRIDVLVSEMARVVPGAEGLPAAALLVAEAPSDAASKQDRDDVLASMLDEIDSLIA